MPVPDVTVLHRELSSYRSAWEDAPTRAALIEAALPRIAAALGLLPEAGPESRLLELGSPPFLTTLCLERVWPGRLTLAGYAATSEPDGSQRLLSDDGQPDKVYEFDVFNVETDEFPYPDATFDVVIFSELIEHLALNPVWALSEIHRVLKPGGHVIITTPNALSLERLDVYLYGGSESVDRYMPLFGYGARHNREWHRDELREVLLQTGFVIEEMIIRDLQTYDLLARLRRAVARLALRWWSRQPRQSHIFLRARRDDVFRWRFPPRLYDHMGFYLLVRHPYIAMGENDSIQCADGWLELEHTSGTGEAVRRVNGANLASRCLAYAIAYLRGRPGAIRFAVRLCATSETGAGKVSGAFRIRSSAGGGETLVEHRFEVPAGAWVDLVAPLVRSPLDREELQVQLEVPSGSEVAVRRLALEP